MAFDASSHNAGPPTFDDGDEPIDWIDWLSRIVVFGTLLVLYVLWIWTTLQPIVRALIG